MGNRVRRRLFWLLVLTAATAAAVVYRMKTRARGAERRDPWPTEPVGGAIPLADRSPGTTSQAEEAPTEAPAIVVATMEATPTRSGAQYEGNGFSSHGDEAVPPAGTTEARFEAPPGSIDPHSGKTRRKRRRSGATLAALGVIAGLGAIALGTWGVVSSVSDDGSSTTTPALENVQQVVSLISKPSTATIPLQGSGRRIILVVGARGYGVLVLNNVGAPPAGKTYEAWVIKPNVKAPQPAGLFSGGTRVVKLTTPVPPGGVVAITVEPAAGSPAPTQKPKLVATRT